jgi:small-conductance mechanosensitive channel
MTVENLLQENWFRWAAGLSLGFPLIMLVLTEVAERLTRLDSPLLSAVKISRQWIVPLAATILLADQVIGIDPNSVPIKLLRTLIWLVIVIVALAAIDAVIFEEAPEDSWQAKVPSILIDLSRTILVLVGLAMILAQVWGADLGGLLTALGVGSLVIGLALQDSMGNLFSGIALLFESPFAVGDWIEIDDQVGRVVAITWRSIHLRTRQRQLIIVPNSVLAKGSFSNYSRPNKIHGEDYFIGFSYDDPPNKVLGILNEIADTTDGILKAPPPIVQTRAYDDFSIRYMLRFFVSDYTDMPRIRAAVSSRIWYATQRYGLTIPFPIQTEYQVEQVVSRDQQETQTILKGLRAVPSFSTMPPATLDSLAQDAQLHEYGQDETALIQGQPITGIYLILQGHAKVTFRDPVGKTHDVGELAAGDVFGERLLLGQSTSDLTVKAGEDLRVIIFDAAIFQSLLDRIPSLATIISETMESRRRTMQHQPP